MEEKPSDRIIDQRIRNRIMDAVRTLADGDVGVRREWPDEYFESFYDWISDGSAMRPNSAVTSDERTMLAELSLLLDQACKATPKVMTADEFIATGWPSRIQPAARQALTLLLYRGRFIEDEEQAEPFSAIPWRCSKAT